MQQHAKKHLTDLFKILRQQFSLKALANSRPCLFPPEAVSLPMKNPTRSWNDLRLRAKTSTSPNAL